MAQHGLGRVLMPYFWYNHGVEGVDGASFSMVDLWARIGVYKW